MSCDDSLVARKFQVNEGIGLATTGLAAGLQMMPVPLTGLRPAPRVRKVPALRRRVPITMLPGPIQPVIIRHAAQDLGKAVSEIQPAQNQRV
jgi:hypothetical protein